MADVKIKAKLRENTGKSATRKYRHDGWIPAEYYSSHDENVHLLLNQKDYEITLLHGHGLIDLQVEGKKSFPCVIKDVQFDPVRGNVLHADFQGVTSGEKLTLDVPIALKGTPAGIKSGGLLEFIVREMEIECVPKDIPENLEIDVSEMEIGDSVQVKDLSYPNIKILNDPEETVLMVVHPKMAKELEELEEAELLEAEEELEPELIGRGREEEEEGEEPEQEEKKKKEKEEEE